MGSVEGFLRDRLAGAERLAVLGAGSMLRSDDAAGPLIIEGLQEAFGARAPEALLLCNGETAPENFSGKIRRFAPTHLLVLDAADVGREPGDIVEIRPDDVGGPTFCSHMLPLRVMIDFLAQETDVRVILLGIQSRSIAFDGEMSAEMRGTVEEIIQALRLIIEDMAA